MKNRAILFRQMARKAPAKKIVKKPVVDEKTIQKVDIESEEILATFASLDEAIEQEGLNRPNLIGALKNGNKYKGFHWKEV